MSLSLLRHALDVCEDPDCEIHHVQAAIDESVIDPIHLAYFAAGAEAMELAIRRHFGGIGYQRRLLVDACREAGIEVLRGANVTAFGCDDCGAPASRECYPEYGCRATSRNVA